MLSVIDEYSRECLAIEVQRRLRSRDVLDVISDLFLTRGVPEHIRSDNVLYTERDVILNARLHRIDLFDTV